METKSSHGPNHGRRSRWHARTTQYRKSESPLRQLLVGWQNSGRELSHSASFVLDVAKHAAVIRDAGDDRPAAANSPSAATSPALPRR
jgi:hypothetical protein